MTVERLGENPDEAVTLTGDGESFTFSDHAWLRISANAVEVRGAVTAPRVKVTGSPRLMLNGKSAQAAIADVYLSFGP